MKTRNDVLIEAINECIYEMYKWSQPSIDVKILLKENFKDNKTHPLYTQHYLSPQNFDFIKNQYADAYGIVDYWDDTFKIIYDQLTEGGIEDDYKPATKKSPAYKDYKKVDPLKEHLKNPEDFDVVIEYIKKIQNFFKHHSKEKNEFNFSICLGWSPCSNKSVVEEYWKDHGKTDFKIKDFDLSEVYYDCEDINKFIKSLK